MLTILVHILSNLRQGKIVVSFRTKIEHNTVRFCTVKQKSLPKFRFGWVNISVDISCDKQNQNFVSIEKLLLKITFVLVWKSFVLPCPGNYIVLLCMHMFLLTVLIHGFQEFCEDKESRERSAEQDSKKFVETCDKIKALFDQMLEIRKTGSKKNQAKVNS